MNRNFSTVIVGAGREAEQVAALVASEEPSCGWASPEAAAPLSLDSLTAWITGQPEPPPVALPSNLIRGAGRVFFKNSGTLMVGADQWRADRFVLALGARP